MMSVPIESIMSSENTTLSEAGFYWLEKEPIKVLVCSALKKAGFENGFSTRVGGVSPFPDSDLNLAGFGEDTDENIAENRSRFLGLFRDTLSLTTVWQVHGDVVKEIVTDEDIATTEDRADGLFSMRRDVLLGVKTADCVPLLIGDPVTGSFASVHAGWRGTVSRIGQKAVELMTKAHGANPSDMICAIGPAATCENYEIGPEVVEQFDEQFDYSSDLFEPTENGHARIDLHLANKKQMIDIGLRQDNIYVAPYCTMERTDLFFSYRREKKLHGKTGRLMSVIGHSG